MGSPALHYALAAASRGQAVLPLSPAKLPAVRSPHRADARSVCQGECGLPGHGVHDATTDPTTIRRLFAAAPWATGYGIACGRAPQHLVGLDLDTKHGHDPMAELARLAHAHGFDLPPTVTVLTPSGGRHLWLRGHPHVAVRNSAGRLAPGIDVRGTGGYLVGPGSLSHSGTYRLATGSLLRAPAPVPAPLLRLLAPPPHRPSAGAPGLGPPGFGPPKPHAETALARFVRSARTGERNARLFWAACRAYESGSGPALAPVLADAAQATGLSAREAHSTIASAARHTAGPATVTDTGDAAAPRGR